MRPNCFSVVNDVFKRMRYKTNTVSNYEYKRFMFNVVGEKDMVNSAATEIKDIIFGLTNKKAEIIMEEKETIMNVFKLDTKYYINKYYFESDGDLNVTADKVVDLSRYIRWKTYDSVHPWNFHVENVDEKYVSTFMRRCSQITCVYPLTATLDDKKNLIDTLIY